MTDSDNPTPREVKAAICLLRVGELTAAEIGQRVGRPPLLVQEILRQAGWPDRGKTLAAGIRWSGFSVGRPSSSEATQHHAPDDSIAALRQLAKRAGTAKLRTAAERLVKAQQQILTEAAEEAAKKAARDAQAKARAHIKALEDEKKTLIAKRRELKASRETVGGRIAEINQQIHALKTGAAA